MIGFMRLGKKRLCLGPVMWLFLGGCYVMPAPVAPGETRPCLAEPDCPPGYTCKFPGVDQPLQCMPGENELDAPVGVP